MGKPGQGTVPAQGPAIRPAFPRNSTTREEWMECGHTTHNTNRPSHQNAHPGQQFPCSYRRLRTPQNRTFLPATHIPQQPWGFTAAGPEKKSLGLEEEEEMMFSCLVLWMLHHDWTWAKPRGPSKQDLWVPF